MASVEAGQFNTVGADRVLEQALACDFSIRSAPRFRLVKAIIRAQQVCNCLRFVKMCLLAADKCSVWLLVVSLCSIFFYH